jgi:hypothetical protein
MTLPDPRPIAEIETVDADVFDRDIQAGYRPVVMRGLAADWPAVRAARTSDTALVDYLRRFDSGKPAEVLVGPPEIAGRFFYEDAMRHTNFQKRHGPLSALLDRLLHIRDMAEPDSLYAGAVSAADYLPGWIEDNPMPLALSGATPRLWIGNATHVSTHFDETSNVAVVVAGRRRFTLFPPEQLGNLYVGPFHFTIAGPPVSMVDLDHPDLDRYPRFAEAMNHAQSAVLEPGDAIYIPPIWWHNVKALSAFNVMANFWWEPPLSQSPLAALLHAIMAVRDLPREHRQAWRAWFDRYVFDDDAAEAAAHLPPHVRGAAGPPTPERNTQLRRQLAAAFSDD